MEPSPFPSALLSSLRNKAPKENAANRSTCLLLNVNYNKSTRLINQSRPNSKTPTSSTSSVINATRLNREIADQSNRQPSKSFSSGQGQRGLHFQLRLLSTLCWRGKVWPHSVTCRFEAGISNFLRRSRRRTASSLLDFGGYVICFGDRVLARFFKSKDSMVFLYQI